MDIPVLRPKALKRGDTIEIVAPAGPVQNRDDFMCGVETLQTLGFHVRFTERVFDRDRYLAGTDAERAQELMRAIMDPEIGAIVSLRGGYGCARIIPLLDQKRIRPLCKILMGFSDLTTLHLFFRRRFGWITFHGPMASSPALAKPQSDQLLHLSRVWSDPEYLPSFSFPTLHGWFPGIAEGELMGGCLSLLTASIGTVYEPITDGKILFLEDLGEPPYRIDRMITQLRLSRKLDHIAGVVLGSFLDCDSDQGISAEDTLRQLFQDLQVPVLAGFPAGHGPENWVLPLGIRVRVDASAGTLDVLEPAVQTS